MTARWAELSDDSVKAIRAWAPFALVSSPHLARTLGVTPQALKNWRHRGQGPAAEPGEEYGPPPTPTFYRVSSVLAWLDGKPEATSWEYERDWLLTNMNGWRVGDDDWGPIDIGPQLNEQQTLSISKGVRERFKLLGFDLGGLKNQPRRKPSLLTPRSCSPPNISSQP